MPLLDINSKTPKIGNKVFIAPDVWVIGDTEICDNVSIFFGAVLRGDILPIKIGSGTNIQEHCILHTSHGLSPCLIGKNVTLGHRAILHGCSVQDNCLIGMGAIILDGAEIGSNTLIGANSLVSMNTKIPAGVLAFGNPAKVVRDLKPEEIKSIEDSARGYQKAGLQYLGLLGTSI